MLDESKVISFDKKIHDFGDVIISDGPVKCTFTFTNISDSPIVVHNIISSCGCATPQWTRSPVKPGKRVKWMWFSIMIRALIPLIRPLHYMFPV